MRPHSVPTHLGPHTHTALRYSHSSGGLGKIPVIDRLPTDVASVAQAASLLPDPSRFPVEQGYTLNDDYSKPNRDHVSTAPLLLSPSRPPFS
ncbi:hypothetical protein J6590_046790 [Homalodisca vitripennis]|nr:hypothetical protein J6590_046790 [Homalodisca vitripennis]